MSESLQWILTALGNALLNSFWQMGGLFLLLNIYTKFNPSLSAAKVSILSFITLFFGFISFLGTFFIHLFSPSLNLFSFGFAIPAYNLRAIANFAAIAYILLFLIPVLRLVNALIYAYRIKKTAIEKVPGHIKIFVLNMRQWLHLKKEVKIFASALVESPLTIGFIKPIILFPIALINQLNTAQVEAIILHELAHIKRNDYLQNIITQVILTLMYFNPFAKLIADLQYTEREKSADQWVLRFDYNNEMYAKTLFQLARQSNVFNNSILVQALGKTNPLLERIQYLFGSNKRKTASTRQLVGLCTILVGLFAFTTFAPADYAPTKAANNTAFLALPQAKFIGNIILDMDNSTSAVVEVPKNKKNLLCKSRIKKKREILNDAFALKNVENVKPLQEQTSSPDNFSFVSNATVIIPELPKESEENLQKTIEATKKVTTELSWKVIENALAETVTTNDKQILKDLYTKKMQSSDWKQQTALLRLNYHNIDWKKANEKIALVLNSLKTDSLYHACKDITSTLKAYKKEIIKAGQASKSEIDSLDKKIDSFDNAIKKMDSLRFKKVVSL